MNFIIYNEASGLITKCMSCSPDIIHLNCAEGEAWLEGEAVDDDEFWVQDGELVERPEELKPVDPTPEYVKERRRAYLSLEEQMDLWFHDPEFLRAHIAEVKARFPKPSAD